MEWGMRRTHQFMNLLAVNASSDVSRSSQLAPTNKSTLLIDDIDYAFGHAEAAGWCRSQPSDWIALGLSLNGGIVTLDQQRWQPAFLRAASWNMGNCESLLLLDTSYSFPVRIKIFTNVSKLMLLFEYAQLSVFMPVRLLKKLCTDREYGTQRFEWSSVHTEFRQLVNNLLNS